MQQWGNILALSDEINNLLHRQPLLVLVANDDREDFLVELDQPVDAMATHHCQQQRALDLILLLPLELLALGEPPQLDGVLELDEGRLLDLDLEAGVINNFHHGHTES